MLLLLASAHGLADVAMGYCRVCTSKACRRDGAQDALTMLRLLGSTAVNSAGTPPAMDSVDAQQLFAARHVETCGCLGQCGKGPNVALCDESGCEILHGVYKPRSAHALLSTCGLSVPDEAAAAVLKRAYAIRALREGRPTEARDLLTAALNQAGALRMSAAYLLTELLELRADVSENLKDQEASAADRERAEQLRSPFLQHT